MQWPQWIETLKERYLAEQASVFVLHGAVTQGRWLFAGEPVGCPVLLRRFLERSRDIVGVLSWDTRDLPARVRLEFPGVQDRALFTRHVGARLTLDGIAQSLNPKTAESALGLIWTSMDTQGTSQGWILTQGQRLHHARKRAAIRPSLGAPELAAWPSDTGLRASNNVVVILVEQLSELHPELVAACSVIQVPESQVSLASAAAPVVERDPMAEIEAALAGASVAPSPEVSKTDAENEVEGALSLRRAPEPPAEPAAAEPAAAEPAAAEPAAAEPAAAEPASPADQDLPLSLRIEAALHQAILRHPKGPWPHRLPGREALAQVLHELLPERVGVLSFAIDDDQVRCSGSGAEFFEQWYQGDIAVDAAVGMALGALAPPSGGFQDEGQLELPAPALRALTRRVEKLLAKA